jgi:hypothetical protein
MSLKKDTIFRLIHALTDEAAAADLIARLELAMISPPASSSSFVSGKAVLGGGGSVTVPASSVLSTSKIFLGAALIPLNGKLHYDTVIDGVSFNIHTGSGADSGHTIDWIIIN